jgi:hypothetical protein
LLLLLLSLLLGFVRSLGRRERAREQGGAMAQRIWRGYRSRKIVRVLLRVREVIRAALKARLLDPVQNAVAVRGCCVSLLALRLAPQRSLSVCVFDSALVSDETTPSICPYRTYLCTPVGQLAICAPV